MRRRSTPVGSSGTIGLSKGSWGTMAELLPLLPGLLSESWELRDSFVGLLSSAQQHHRGAWLRNGKVKANQSKSKSILRALAWHLLQGFKQL